MLDKNQIIMSLDLCNEIYNQQNDSTKQKFVLKVALLEACGWIEDSLDEVYFSHKFTDSKYDKTFESKIRSIHGFGIENIESGLVYLIGYHNFIDLFYSIDSEERERAASSLGVLKKKRNIFAHKISNGLPDDDYLGISSIKNHIENIFPFLESVYKYLITKQFISDDV